jgi:ribosomal protein S18 acetylase RimI-like enzyme
MGNRGRFGKYGDIKRVDRLCCSRIFIHRSEKEKRIELFRPKKLSEQGLSQDSGIIVRPADGSETGFIKRLSRKAFNLYGSYEEIIPKWFESDVTITFIALAKGQLTGYAMIGESLEVYDSEQAAELLAIAVEAKNQRRGVGELLLKELERKTGEVGLNRIYLHTATKNLSAQKLFAHRGYRIAGIRKNFYPRGQDAFIMSKDLLKLF